MCFAAFRKCAAPDGKGDCFPLFYLLAANFPMISEERCDDRAESAKGPVAG